MAAETKVEFKFMLEAEDVSTIKTVTFFLKKSGQGVYLMARTEKNTWTLLELMPNKAILVCRGVMEHIGIPTTGNGRVITTNSWGTGESC